jgi:hypothetical protein
MREPVAKPHSRQWDLVVVMPVKKWTCTSCGGTGDLLKMEDGGPLCVDCADLGHLVFLPSGDAALTRRAKRISGLSAVVVRWSRTRERYERQGILAEAEAVERAEQECLSDAEARARRRERDKARRASDDVRFQTEFAAAIRNLSRAVPPAGLTGWRVTRQRAAVAGSDEARPREPFTPTPFTSPLRHRSGTSTPATTSY